MKTIGFIDYYISEWHANHYPKWIKEANEKLKTEFRVKYAWAEKDISPVDGRSTDEWCAAFGVTRCNTIEELCERSDYIVILAPTDPDKHLQYASKAFKYGKRTYVDKTFAPSLKEAKQIIELSEKYGAKFFTSSALRFADELTELDGQCETVTSIGSGASIDEYIIHQTEMLVKCMGTGAKRLKSLNDGDQHFIRIEYGDGRTANILFCSQYGVGAAIIPRKKGGDNSKYIPIESDFFKTLLTDILRFFDGGVLPFDTAQTLEVMAIRDAIIKSCNGKEEEWIEI